MNSYFQETVGPNVHLILGVVNLQIFREERQIRTGKMRYLNELDLLCILLRKL